MPTKKHSSELQQKIDAKRRRGGRGGRQPAFTPDQKQQVAREYADDEAATCRSLGAKYNRSPSTIWRVIKAIGAVLLLSTNGWGALANERRVLWLDSGPHPVRVLGVMATEETCRTVARGLNDMEDSSGSPFSFICRRPAPKAVQS